MAKIYASIDELVGNTPLLRLSRIEEQYGLRIKLLGKLEYLNPAGSIKDRVAKEMLDNAEAKGILKPDSVIIEPTSGNTGIGLAAIGARRGYRVMIVMPDTMSMERRTLMKAYGAELVLSEGKLGMKGAIQKAEALAKEIPNAWIAGQFVNPANPEAHRKTTGPEIYRDTDGAVDTLIAGIGTGGTLTGAGEYLKSVKPEVEIVGVEPAGSPVLSGGEAGPHGLQGIGAGFVPEILNTEIYDRIATVSDEEALTLGRETGRLEGILVGISSGAALHAAVQYGLRPENAGKTVVVILPDTGDRYLSTPLFS
jgi:cysteine synthase A